MTDEHKTPEAADVSPSASKAQLCGTLAGPLWPQTGCEFSMLLFRFPYSFWIKIAGYGFHFSLSKYWNRPYTKRIYFLGPIAFQWLKPTHNAN